MTSGAGREMTREELVVEVGRLRAENARLIAERTAVWDAFELVETWYCRDGAPITPTFFDMLTDVVADLVAGRAEIKSLRALLGEANKKSILTTQPAVYYSDEMGGWHQRDDGGWGPSAGCVSELIVEEYIADILGQLAIARTEARDEAEKVCIEANCRWCTEMGMPAFHRGGWVHLLSEERWMKGDVECVSGYGCRSDGTYELRRTRAEAEGGEPSSTCTDQAPASVAPAPPADQTDEQQQD